MPDTSVLPPFRPMAMLPPDIHVRRSDTGAIYLTPNQPPGDRPRTLPHCLAQRAAEHPDRVFLKQRAEPGGPWREMSYGDVKRASDGLAQALLELGAGPDRPVMILSGNSIESAIVILAAMSIGAPAAPPSASRSSRRSSGRCRASSSAFHAGDNAPGAAAAARGGLPAPASSAGRRGDSGDRQSPRIPPSGRRRAR